MYHPFVLVACERSQVVQSAFLRKGCISFSCDIEPCLGSFPGFHILGDVSQFLHPPILFRTQSGGRFFVPRWDLVVAHPPCTFLSKAGTRAYFSGGFNVSRFFKGLAARDFFMQFYNLDCPHICIENPVPLKLFHLPRESQSIQPYFFGHEYSKQTYLWLHGLPPLFATEICLPRFSYTDVCRGFDRSRFHPGIASAMADQWIPFLL